MTHPFDRDIHYTHRPADFRYDVFDNAGAWIASARTPGAGDEAADEVQYVRILDQPPVGSTRTPGIMHILASEIIPFSEAYPTPETLVIRASAPPQQLAVPSDVVSLWPADIATPSTCLNCGRLGYQPINGDGWVLVGRANGGWGETCDCGWKPTPHQRCLLCGGDHSAEDCPRIHPIDAAALLHEADAVIGRLYCPLCLGNHLLRDCPLKHGDHATEADVLLSQTASHPGPDCSCPDCTRAAERLIIDAFMTRLRFDAGVLCSFCYPNHAEAEANARLISAAPELLAACEAAQQCITDFLDVYTRGCSMQVLDLAVRDLKVDALRRIKAALEKATA